MIRYPLTPPDATYAGARLGLRSIVGVHASEFTAKQEVQEHAGQLWELDLALANRGRAAVAAWQSFLTRLRGRRGTFVQGDPAAPSPRGGAVTATSNPTANGASQTGNDLLTQGWLASQNGLLLPGDYVQIAMNYLVSPNDLENAAWTKNECTADNNTTDVTDPLGTNTATKITPGASVTNVRVYQQITAAVDHEPGFRFGGSVWLRAASGTPSITTYLVYDVNNSAASSVVCNLTTAWQQFILPTATFPASADRVGMRIGGANTWPEADGPVYVWGAEVHALEYHARLHMVTSQFDSDSNGRGTLEVVPRLREIDNHARVIYSSPVGLWRLADNLVGWSEAPPVRYTDMSLRAVEAL